MNIPHILNTAADVIEEHGHAKHVLMTWDGSYCANGAIVVATGASPTPNEGAWGIDDYTPERQIMARTARTALENHLGINGDWVTGQDVPRWNNADERTATEVVEALRAAAAIEQSKLDTTTKAEVPA